MLNTDGIWTEVMMWPTKESAH